MLGSLRGNILVRTDQRLLIEVAGLGYWVHTGSWQPEGEVLCYIYHNIREGSEDLYGFVSLENLTLFERLLGISGIGPKAALSLLSIGNPERIQQAVVAKDISFLTSAPGIGQKAAQKIILELFGKMDTIDSLLPGQGVPSAYQEVSEAMQSLGYRLNDIRSLLETIPAEHTTVDAQLKWLLQNLK